MEVNEPAATTASAAHRREQVFSGKRRRVYAINTVLVALAAMLITVQINYIGFFHYRRYDFSRGAKFTISERTKTMLRALDKDVEIVCLMPGRAGMTAQVRDTLDLVREHTGRLDIRFIDPGVEKSDAESYLKTHSLQVRNLNFVIVFRCGDKIRVMEEDELVKRGIISSFVGEEVFYYGIRTVTSDEVTKLYFATGHGERVPTDASDFGLAHLAPVLELEAIEWDLCDLSKPVPADCSALVICGPGEGGVSQFHYSADEVNVLSDYLDRNGKVFLMLDPYLAVVPVSDGSGKAVLQWQDCGLEQLFAKWGIGLFNGVIIDRDRTPSNEPWDHFVVTGYTMHDITERMKGVTTYFQSVRPVDVDTRATGLRVKAFLFAGETAFHEGRLYDQGRRLDFGSQVYRDLVGDYRGKSAVPFGAVSTNQKSEQDAQSARIVVIGDSDFVSQANVSVRRGNIDLFMNSVYWLLEQKERMQAPQEIIDNRLQMTDAQDDKLYIWVVWAIPGIALLLGCAIWFVRRS